MTNDDLRAAVLRVTVEAANANELPLKISHYLRALGLDDSMSGQVSNAIAYLKDSGLIVAKEVPTLKVKWDLYLVTGVRPLGFDTVEHPHRQTAVSPQSIIQNFNAPVAVVQTGNHNTANVQQNFVADVAALLAALSSLREETSGIDDVHAVNVLAAEAETEIRSSHSVTQKAKSLLESLGTIVQTLAATPGAYVAVVDAAHNLQVMLPH